MPPTSHQLENSGQTLGAREDETPQQQQQQPQQQQQQQDVQPLSPRTSEARDRTEQDLDEDMRSESDLFTEHEKPSEEESIALKKLRISKEAYSSAWDDEMKNTLRPSCPDFVLDWVKMYGDKEPYNQDFDKARYADVPTCVYANPNYWFTQRGERKPEFPLEGHQPFTPGPLPHVHISDWRHLGNIQDQQQEQVKERKDSLLALVPHGGGREMNKAAKKIAQCFQEFLNSLRFKSYGGQSVDVTIHPPDPRNAGGPGSKNPFAQPWTFYVDIQEDPLDLMREFLLYQEHFAISPACSFSIHPLNSVNPQSWKLLVLASPYIMGPGAPHNSVIAMREATRRVVIDKLKAHRGYREHIAKLAANHIGHTGDHEQVFKTITDTYHLQPVVAETKDGETSAYILYARPLTSTRKENDTLKDLIREALCGVGSEHFYVNMRKIHVIDDSKKGVPPVVDCKLCKSETHTTAACPLPKTRGWRGLNATDLGRDGEPTAEKAGTSRDDQHATMEEVLNAIRGRTATSSPKGKKGRGGAAGRGRGQYGRGGRTAHRA
ncbi:hypothetical protein BD311DRAFT_747098 [Dichomitus squalens]|uniref:Uncharacterized protein n=1 Tax=Dichomitus squalens TaxID=114155 RepID=A0A4Q9N0V9_9APHY|nr:hypothetical protein BD311DRAFT_747098 [Dichomitus squalens]